MQLVRTYQILGYLGDVAVFVRREKLRAYRSIVNAHQDLAEVCAADSSRVVLHDVTNKRFRNGSVHAVHRHVVAVVGSPAERKLRKVSCAYYHAVFSICEIHEYLGALPCLTVFVHHIVVALVVADILEVLLYRIGNIYHAQPCPEQLAEPLRVAAGALCRTEAGHCDRQYIRRGSAEQLHSLHAHQQRKRGIQPAGNSDHQRFRVGVADALFKPMCLHCEDILAALVGLRRGIRNERSAAHYSGKLCGLYFHIERNTAHSRAQTSHEASVAAALGSKLLDVYFSNGQPG